MILQNHGSKETGSKVKWSENLKYDLKFYPVKINSLYGKMLGLAHLMPPFI